MQARHTELGGWGGGGIGLKVFLLCVADQYAKNRVGKKAFVQLECVCASAFVRCKAVRRAAKVTPETRNLAVC